MKLSSPGIAAAFVLLAACNSLSSSEHARLATFDTYWEALNDRYPYFGRKTIDWEELGKQYRSAVPVVEQPIDFYHVLAGMLCELLDNHVSLDLPRSLSDEGAPLLTRLDRREGFGLARIGSRIHVTSWPAGEEPTPPAHLPEELRVLPEVYKVEGAFAVQSLLDVLFTGAAGSPTELLLRWHDGTLTHHALRRPTDPTEDPGVIEIGPGMKLELVEPIRFELHEGMATLRIDHFRTSGSDDWFAAADRAIDAAIAHGGDLVIDVRGNGGGALAACLHAVSRFLKSPQRVIRDDPDRRWLLGLVTVRSFGGIDVEPRDPRFEGGVAVLIDNGSASAAEHFARLMQLSGAVLIGDRTRGVEAAVKDVAGPDGSSLRFGEKSLLDARGRRLQDEGVHPDVALPLQWDDVRRVGFDEAFRQWEEQLYAAAKAELSRRVPGVASQSRK